MVRKQSYNGTICVFLALVLLLIMSLILVFLESASHAASASYAQMLQKTATGSVMGEYYGPLFAEYGILAIDSGFDTKKTDSKELERRLMRYMEDENVWGYTCEDIRVTDMKKLLDNDGTEFLSQAISYEKYAAAEDVLDEITSRLKSLGDQKAITKVMEKRMDIEDELAVIDKKTLELMKLIDGVNLTLGAKTSSLLGYDIEEWFIKKLYVGENSMTGTGINNPSVYENLKGRYADIVDLSSTYKAALKVYADKVKAISAELEKIDALYTELGVCGETIKLKEEEIEEKKKVTEELEEKIAEIEQKAASDDAEETDDTEENKTEESKPEKKPAQKTEAKKDDSTSKEKELDALKKELAEINSSIEELNEQIAELERSKADIAILIEELSESIAGKQMEIDDIAGNLKKVSDYVYTLLTEVITKLSRVCEIVDEVAEKQEKVKPLIDDFEGILRTVGPILSNDLKEEMEETLDFMKAYVGYGNSKITTTDFDAIKKTAEYDLALLSGIDIEAYRFTGADTYEEAMEKLGRLPEDDGVFKSFSYSGFSFDYSEIQESALENKLVAEFEDNVADGYLSLFLPDNVKLSDNAMLSELLPSLWYEVEGEKEDDLESITDGADDKGGGELLSDADEGSGLSDIADLVTDGFEALGSKLLSSMYMRHQFKSFKNRSVEGDTVLDYELEYILSGFETDKANLSAAATKIMLLRLAICTVYTLTQKDLKAQAQTLAISIMGFTGLPFLITIVKYLILFLWAAAQAVIETAAILRGKKVPIIPNSDSFCLSLAELPFFATLIDEKADNFSESKLYLDYDDYLLVLTLLQSEKTTAARALDIIQENIRYKYNDDFLISNAVTSFSCTATFRAPYKYTGLLGLTEAGAGYMVEVTDRVAY